MKKVAALVCSVLICLVIYSCKKNKLGINNKAFYDCDKTQNLDTTAIANKLVGKWRLRSTLCGECTANGWKKPDKTVFVTFTSPRQFSITENSVVVAQGDWSFKTFFGSDRWGLYPTSTSSFKYFFGYILLCENQVMFLSSFTDGPDKLFDKVD